MRPRRIAANLAMSLWLHASVAAIFGLSFPSLFAPTPTGDTDDAAGIETDVDGQDPNGVASTELMPVAVQVIDESEAATPPPPPPAAPPVQAEEPVVPPSLQPATGPPLAAAKQDDDTKATPSAPSPKTLPNAKPASPTRTTAKGGAAGSAPQRRQSGPPCEPPISGIAQLTPDMWQVERAVVEYYALHLPELYKQGSVWAHQDAAGKTDGFRVGLSKCSIIRQAGIKSGDVVRRINNRKITSIPQAIAAYFDLRNEPILEVHVLRAGKEVTLRYQLDQPGTRSERKAMDKAARKQIKEELANREKK